jgi:hypothetical protein
LVDERATLQIRSERLIGRHDLDGRQRQGVNDITISNAPSEWIAGPAPTYVSATQFTLAGDQTLTFTAGRRVKTTNFGGTIYSIITSATFGVLTTVTITNDSGSLDAGLSAVSYGMLASSSQSSPPATDVYPQFENNADKTKRMTVSLSALTTGTNRTATAPDSNFTLGTPRGFIDGLTMSTAGSSATMAIAAGIGRDSTNAADITLAASISKTTASFVVGTGNGCIDTGAIANTTWYHFFVILRPDTGVVDVLCSVSATAPTMPANYSYKRRIGSMKTNGSAQWISFVQYGDTFSLVTLVADITSVNPGTAAVTRTLASVPTGIVVEAMLGIVMQNVAAGGNSYTYISDLATTDSTPGTSISDIPVALNSSGGAFISAGGKRVMTNTSAQVRSRISFSDASCTLILNTLGWIDRRGRDQ